MNRRTLLVFMMLFALSLHHVKSQTQWPDSLLGLYKDVSMDELKLLELGSDTFGISSIELEIKICALLNSELKIYGRNIDGKFNKHFCSNYFKGDSFGRFVLCNYDTSQTNIYWNNIAYFKIKMHTGNHLLFNLIRHEIGYTLLSFFHDSSKNSITPLLTVAKTLGDIGYFENAKSQFHFGTKSFKIGTTAFSQTRSENDTFFHIKIYTLCYEFSYQGDCIHKSVFLSTESKATDSWEEQMNYSIPLYEEVFKQK